MTELVLIRGLPGSGKTTMALEFKARGYVHVEAAMAMTDPDGRYTFDPSRLQFAHEWCRMVAEAALETGQSVVVSNTFTQRWEIEPYQAMAEACGVPCRIIEATGSWPNVHGVPESVIERMRARWETIE